MFSNVRLSIDIRGHIIKFLEGRLVDDGIVKISKAAYLDFKGLMLSDEKMIYCQENIEAIKKFLKRHGFSAKKVLLNISDSKVITRLIKLPKLSLEDLDGLVKVEAPKYLPIDLSKFYMDYRILNTINENDKVYYKVLLCAIPRDIVKEYVDIIIACGLEPILVDIHPNSVSRLYEELEFEDIAVIDGGIESADLLILDNGDFYIYTTFDFDIPNFGQLQRNCSEYDTSKVNDNLLKLAKEIENYLQFYLSRNEGKKIDTIFVIGDLSLIPGVEDILQSALSELGVKVSKGFNHFVDIIKTKKSYKVDENAFCANIGILLRGV